MKNQAPIKRHQAIVSFSKDHHFGLLLVWKIRQGLKKSIDPVRISNYVLFFFKEDLEKHFTEEEQLLYAELPLNDLLRNEAESDHEAISNIIHAIPKRKNDTQLLCQLAYELESHIRFEERELFNHLQNNIAAQNLDEIAKRFPNSTKETDEIWFDKFWEASL